MKNYKYSKTCILNNINRSYEIIQSLENAQKKFNIDTIENQYMERNILNAFIREYIAIGGKKNIDKYLKYYV